MSDRPKPLTGDELAALILALPPEQRAKPFAFNYDGVMHAVSGVDPFPEYAEDEPEWVEITGGHQILRLLHPEDYGEDW